MDKSHIWYWVIMAVLIAGSVALLYSAMMARKKERLEDAERARKRSRARNRERETAAEGEAAHRKSSQKKRLWKLILQDADSDRRYSIIFYDSIGIGRVRDGEGFEKFISLTGDGRVSKLHCSIIHREDRLYLQDEGSRNGTFLNGKKVVTPSMIQKDDMIGIGETHLEVVSVQRESR